MYRYFSKNIRPFSAICRNDYGRKVIFTNQNKIDGSNIVKELGKALPIHNQNAKEIDYLNRYYCGDQPILYREKKIRPEINNKLVLNLAYMAVETKVAEMISEPVQYNLRGTDDTKSEQVAELNSIMDSEDKSFFDISLCRWRSIAGTAYRYIGNNENHGVLMDETSFCFHTENPMTTFVVYHNDGFPAFSCQIRTDEDEQEIYNIFTNTEFFAIKQGNIVSHGANANYAIPVIEYPNNERRLSDVEITISITDELSRMASDRANGIEGFVNSFIKFVNCEIDRETYHEMREEGAFVVKSNNGSDNKADVDLMTNELNQTESQVAVADLFDKFLVIQGIANREGNTGGDTQGAVEMRNGWYAASLRMDICEPIFKRSEKQSLRIILNRLRIERGFSLVPSDIEIKIPRSKADNMQVKAQSLQMLLNSGIYPPRAIKTVGLFADPEQVAQESQKRMELLYPDEKQEPVMPTEVIDVEEQQVDNNDENAKV